MEILGRRYRIGTIIKVVFAVMGASSGISMCGVFRKKYNNVHGAVWAGASAAFAIFFLYIVFSVHRDVNRKIPPSRFKSYSFVGAVGAMAGLAGSIAYLIIAATNKESGIVLINIIFKSFLFCKQIGLVSHPLHYDIVLSVHYFLWITEKFPMLCS